MPIKPLLLFLLCVCVRARVRAKEIPGIAEEKWRNESNKGSQKKEKETQERFINFNNH